MKDKIKAIAKGIALGAAAIAAASVLFGCQTMPPVTVRGNYGDYHFDAKGGLVITPRTTIVEIDRRGAK